MKTLLKPSSSSRLLIFSYLEALIRLYASGTSGRQSVFVVLAVDCTPITRRDLSYPESTEPLRSMGSISSHTRPVECIDGKATSDTTAILYTGDTMGIIKVWELKKEDGPNPRWIPTLADTISHHRTRINELYYGQGQLWTGDFSSLFKGQKVRNAH